MLEYFHPFGSQCAFLINSVKLNESGAVSQNNITTLFYLLQTFRTMSLPSANPYELCDMYVLPNTEVEILDDGGLQLVELNPIDPWLADPREPLELQEGEVKVCAFCCSHSVLFTP